MLIDTHCHVSFEAYKNDAEYVVKRALDADVKMITVGTRIETSRAALAFAEAHEGVWATVGLHPGHVHAQDFVDANEMPSGMTGSNPIGKPSDAVAARHMAEAFDPEVYRAMLAHPKVVAVGECGLDYYRLPPGISAEQMKEDQKVAVRAQLRLASEAGKPVVIHCRNAASAPSISPLAGGEARSAHQDQAEMIREEIAAGGLARRGLIHCFTGTAEEAAMYAELHFLVAFGGILTFGKNVAEAARVIPLEQIVLETDAPYLTPAPFRGKRNEPVHVRLVAEKLAALKGVSVGEIERVTTANAIRLFGLTKMGE